MKKLAALLLSVLLSGTLRAGTLYVDTGGATTNSGSTDQNAANLSGSAATAVTTTITLDGSPNLSALVTSGATQSSIYLAQATNSNKKIFWVTAVDDGLDTVTVDEAPSGIVSSAWAIGGRHVLTNASIEGSVRAGDTVIFNNSPASRSGTAWTFQNAGTTAGGFATIRGKTGTRPQLITTGSSTGVSMGQALCKVENLEIIQQGASSQAIDVSGGGSVIANVKISDAGSSGGIVVSAPIKVFASEITGSAGDGIVSSSVNGAFIGNYIHDNAGAGYSNSAANINLHLAYNVFDSNVGNNITISGSMANQAAGSILVGNVVYGSNAHGLGITDADWTWVMVNNIFLDNGNTGTEYNVNFPSGSGQNTGYSSNNIFSQAGARGGTNFNNFAAGTADLTSDPAFTAPISGDFTIPTTSPAKAAGYPGVFIGGSTGYMDIGAVQRQESSSSGSGTGACSDLKVGTGACAGISIR